MKKLLLTVACAALTGFSAAYAQDDTPVVYFQGDKVTSIADLETGTYFIRAHNHNSESEKDRGEFMLMMANTDSDTKGGSFGGRMSTTYDLGTSATSNTNLLWRIVVSDAQAPEDWVPYGDGVTFSGKVFTIQNVATGQYLSIQGRDGNDEYPAKNPIWRTDDETKAGKFQLVDFQMPDNHPEYYGSYTDCKRFFFQLTNAKFYNGADKIGYPFIHYNTDNPAHLSYWRLYDLTGTAVQFDLVKADASTTVPVTVKFPAINGLAVADQVINLPLGKEPTETLTDYIPTLNMGGFTITNITSSTGSTVITTADQVLTLEGQWEREIIPGHVYRLRNRPASDSHGALRYMISTGEIETQRENKQTLDRLVPERLWYFTVEGEGDSKTYKVHTLYDTSKALHFEKTAATWNHATASLAEEGTPMVINPHADGDFNLKIAGTTNAYINDFGDLGLLSVWDESSSTPEKPGSIMRVYPLTEDDFAILADFGTAEEIAAAKAAPTVDNVKPLIDAYDADNIEAALKRVSYIFNSGVIGTNPGQYSDKDNEFAAAVETLRAVSQNPDATIEEIEAAIAAVNGMIEGTTAAQLSLNQMANGFYRFRNKVNNKRYLSALSGGTVTAGGKQKPAMAMTEDNTRSNTVFYVEALDTNEDPALINYNVVCYENGLVLPGLVGDSWLPALNGTAGASENVNFNMQDDNCFVIHVRFDGDSHRHLHGGNAGSEIANAGGATDDGYRWYIERVTELPITFYNVMGQDGYDDDGWASIYSPVALELPAEYTHTTAYTGVFDDTDYTGKPDINHVHATKIEPVDGKVIIPANQPALLFYDGEETGAENPNVSESLMPSRSEITYVNLPLLYDYESTAEVKGNLNGSIFATPNAEGKDFFTLHASHNNNFREYGEYMTDGYTFIPGFKAHLTMDHNEEDTFYPIYTINPNTMVTLPDDTDNGYKVTLDEENPGKIYLTVETPDDTYQVYYKQVSTKASAPMLRANSPVDHSGYVVAKQQGNVHTMEVVDGDVEYYAYHADTNLKGAVRTATVDTTGLDAIITEGSAVKVYDLQGRKLAAPTRGINIINGQKTLVK